MNHQGFTLIELSIVLVIIGLLVGGVLTGKTLIAQARINRVMTDMQKFDTAVNTFQGKYDALPGDYTKATQAWGAAGGTASDNYTASCYASSSLTATCNGNGSGTIDYSYEMYRFWQHLSLAGLIEGTYTGVSYSKTPGSVLCVIGQNCPPAPNNGGYELFPGPITVATAAGVNPPFWEPPMSDKHAILYGAQVNVPAGSADAWTAYPLLSASEASGLDKKYDDGVPLTGSILVFSGYAPSCITPTYSTLTAGTYNTATYNVAQPGSICNMIRVAGF